MAKKGAEKTGEIVKRDVHKQFAQMDKDPDFQQKIHADCTTHSMVLQMRRVKIQSRLEKLYRLYRDIESGKIAPEDEAKANQIGSAMTTLGMFEVLTYIADCLSVRQAVGKTKDGKPQYLGTKLVSIAKTMQSIENIADSNADDSAVLSHMLYKFLKKHHPAILAEQEKDENGVLVDNPDIFADHFSEEEKEIPDDEQFMVDEDESDEVFSESIEEAVKAAKERAAKAAENKNRRSHSEGGAQ